MRSTKSRHESLVLLHIGPRAAMLERVGLTRISHRLTSKAHDRPAITSLRLLAVLTVLFKYASLLKKWGAKRRAPRTDGPFMHFASPRGEKSGLDRAPIEVPARPCVELSLLDNEQARRKAGLKSSTRKITRLRRTQRGAGRLDATSYNGRPAPAWPRPLAAARNPHRKPSSPRLQPSPRRSARSSTPSATNCPIRPRTS